MLILLMLYTVVSVDWLDFWNGKFPGFLGRLLAMMLQLRPQNHGLKIETYQK